MEVVIASGDLRDHWISGQLSKGISLFAEVRLILGCEQMCPGMFQARELCVRLLWGGRTEASSS